MDQTSAPTTVGDRKLKALIFYTINPLLYEKWPLCIFETLFQSLGATYAVHFRIIGKPVVEFLLVIIELFLLGATWYGSGAMSQYRLEIVVFEGGGSLRPKISGRR